MARIRGTNGHDWLNGTREDDEFYGYDGNDTFVHSPGNDTYYGGAGAHDQVNYSYARSGIWVDLSKGVGTDGEGGKEYFYDIEQIVGSHFNDRISGDDEPNSFHGSGGDDVLIGYGGIDSLHGDEGDDRLYGGAEGDLLSGGDGDDLLVGEGGGDTIYGGDGVDTVSYLGSAQPVFASLTNWNGLFDDADGGGFNGDAEGDRFYDVENITGSAYGDILFGSAGSNVLRGEGGDDRLEGGDGGDVLNGGEGIDWASYEGASSGVVADLLYPAFNTGDAEGDTYISIENLAGTYYDDTLKGDDNPNVIAGGLGHDWLYGRGGDDRFLVTGETSLVDGGSGVDSIAFHTGVGVTVTLDSNGNGLAVNAYGFTYLYGIENVNGTETNDTLRGGAQANLFDGNAGNDIIDGGGGDDVLFGGENADTFLFNHLGQGNQNQHDTIGDFTPGVDDIDLSDTPVQNFNDLFSPGDRFMQQVGNDVLIHTSVSASTSILLQNVQMSSLSSADFLF